MFRFLSAHCREESSAKLLKDVVVSGNDLAILLSPSDIF